MIHNLALIVESLAWVAVVCAILFALALLAVAPTAKQRVERMEAEALASDADTFDEPTRADIEWDLHNATTPDLAYFNPEQRAKARRILDQIRANQRARFEREALAEIELLTGEAS